MKFFGDKRWGIMGKTSGGRGGREGGKGRLETLYQGKGVDKTKTMEETQ
jgi:hypothetical protein